MFCNVIPYSKYNGNSYKYNNWVSKIPKKEMEWGGIMESKIPYKKGFSNKNRWGNWW